MHTFYILLGIFVWVGIGVFIIGKTLRIRHVISMIAYEHPTIALLMLFWYIIAWPFTLVLDIYARARK